MHITHLTLRNWRNFQAVDVDLHPRVFLIGPNASGKTNFLDALRFLRDIASVGLQAAVLARGGVAALRNLGASSDADIEIAVVVTGDAGDWRYRLTINHDSLLRAHVRRESLSRQDDILTREPGIEISEDGRRTLLERLTPQDNFHDCRAFLQRIASPLPAHGNALDPDLPGHVWQTPSRTRTARMKKIQRVLQLAMPQLGMLTIAADKRGVPHLLVTSSTWLPHVANNELGMSDGTLRLFSLLWGLLDGDGPILLEEPEQSLHQSVVAQLAQLVGQINRQLPVPRQILISTHSEDLLYDRGIAAEEVLRLVPVAGGTVVVTADASERQMMREGMSVAEVMLPKSAPSRSAQLALES